MRGWLRYLSLVMVAVLVSGCATDVVMRDPRTGETATCKASLAGFNPWSQQDACIGEHIAGGWVRAE
jgi:uncharacterized protein YceK